MNNQELPAGTDRLDVLGLGAVAIDDLLYVAEYPPADSKMQVQRSERQCGGLSATALVAAARLGARCAYAGVLGHDDLSQFVLARFAAEGIDVGLTRRRDGVRPVHSVIVVEQPSGKRTIFYDLEGTLGADPDWPEEAAIRSSRVLFVDHFGMDGMIRAAGIARTAGVAVVADFERDNVPRFDELMALVDHLILSQDFAADLTGCSDPAAAAAKLWTPSRQGVVVTAGANGCWCVDAGRPDTPWHQPAFRVKVVDTTGCGDVFHGAYAAALALGLDLPARLRFASATAALKATRRGGQTGIPSRSAVETFLAEHD